VDRLVGDLGENCVVGRDQEVDAEAAGHAGERGRHAGQGVSPDTQERGGPEGDEHQVAGV